MAVTGYIEDHANNTPYVVQKLRRIADDMRYIYATELIHAAKAIDPRKRAGNGKFGKGTEKIWTAFHKKWPFTKMNAPSRPTYRPPTN